MSLDMISLITPKDIAMMLKKIKAANNWDKFETQVDSGSENPDDSLALSIEKPQESGRKHGVLLSLAWAQQQDGALLMNVERQNRTENLFCVVAQDSTNDGKPVRKIPMEIKAVQSSISPKADAIKPAGMTEKSTNTPALYHRNALLGYSWNEQRRRKIENLFCVIPKDSTVDVTSVATEIKENTNVTRAFQHPRALLRKTWKVKRQRKVEHLSCVVPSDSSDTVTPVSTEKSENTATGHALSHPHALLGKTWNVERKRMIQELFCVAPKVEVKSAVIRSQEQHVYEVMPEATAVIHDATFLTAETEVTSAKVETAEVRKRRPGLFRRVIRTFNMCSRSSGVNMFSLLFLFQT